MADARCSAQMVKAAGLEQTAARFAAPPTDDQLIVRGRRNGVCCRYRLVGWSAGRLVGWSAERCLHASRLGGARRLLALKRPV